MVQMQKAAKSRTLTWILLASIVAGIGVMRWQSSDAADIINNTQNRLGIALTSQQAAAEICDNIDLVGGVTAGTATASKAVVLNTNKGVTQFYVQGVAGTKTLSGIPITIRFAVDAAETLTWTVPTGYDLIVTNAIGFKSKGAGDNAADQWDLKHNDGSAANIFDTAELTGVNDGAFVQFTGLADTEEEIEAGETLDLVAGEDNDPGCDGYVIVTGILKIAD